MMRSFLIAAVFFLALAVPAHAFGVQDATAPDPDDKPLAIRIWYPSGSGNDAKISGTALPLIIISHGTGGSLMGHTDTAIALAQAGFVVAAVNHTGDNYKDDSYVGRGLHLIGRPRHISRVIDYMLTLWPEHARIDPARIGMFGHSAGGFTALVIAGAEPDMSRGVVHCREHPSAWDCLYLEKHGLKLRERPASSPPLVWPRDARVKAAVIAAPAVGYAFEPNGLSKVAIPIQLWEAEKDTIVDDSPATVRRLLPEKPDDHLVPGAGHLSFIAPCDWRLNAIVTVMSWFRTLNFCADPAGFDRPTFHKAFNTAVIDFFLRTLPPQPRLASPSR